MKKVIDILGIILPVLIILLAIARSFLRKPQGINGLTVFFAVILLIVGLVRYFMFPGKASPDQEPKPVPITVSQHSLGFNKSLGEMLDSYYQLTGALRNMDTIEIRAAASRLNSVLDSLPVDELKTDSLIYQTAQQPFENARAEIRSIMTDPSLAEIRASFHMLSTELFTLLSVTRYEGGELYWLECPGALGQEIAGNWLSHQKESANPYGKKEPCAELRTTIRFIPTDTTKQQ